jgi:hypothetical protein
VAAEFFIIVPHRRSAQGVAEMRPKSSKQKRNQPLAPGPSSSGNVPKPYDELVPDKLARHECGGVSRMTFYRWEKDPKLQLPPAILIRKRKYRSRNGLEQFKAGLKAKGRL